MTLPPGTARPDLESALLSLEPGDGPAFDAVRDAIRAYQATRNPVIAAFEPDGGRFLPVAAFREVRVACFPPEEEEGSFVSSGTGSGHRARHPVRSFAWYDRVCVAGFVRTFSNRRRVIVGHLPEYADHSSLVRMVRVLASGTGTAAPQVQVFDPAGMVDAALRAASERLPFLVIGAAFGLLDLLEGGPVPLPGDVRIIETGGMKTRRREVDRETLHARLAQGFGVPVHRVGSEYGMCELTSQAWSRCGEWFDPPPWMRVSVVDPEDPERPLGNGMPGRLAVEDLANLYSAAFLLTEDLGVVEGRRFTVTGRALGSPMRGCNLLFES